ncbi:hypothetical protein L9F63_008562 [Diploptera punctata]|uniref:N-glycosylase/DNA lyase n=1 Tax=Diploptera punctata TaxID=6984 RepID=A0AAD7Z5A1_DIPPU|nr:hypothetical protein L9F63_008562 [Diploptera punctata]
MWNKLQCPRTELELLFTLCGGQCFRWRKSGNNEWTGVFGKRVWILSQDESNILYKVVTSSQQQTKGRKRKLEKEPLAKTTNKHGDDDLSVEREMLREYFRLDVPLEQHYAQWSSQDPHFKSAAVKFKGVRILAQDPVENVFSFICSSNNNIARISSMVEKLCSLYGQQIAEVDGTMYYDFPPVEALTGTSVENKLREAGFGYRAKYIHQSACRIMEMGGADWLDKLKTLSYVEAKTQLIKLSGVGAKVADCICLMSLGHLESIPVDTHIYQVAAQNYLPHLRGRKTVTDKMYTEIGEHFRTLYGPLAGWAHTILFCADLKMFQEDTPAKKKKKA